MADHPANLSPAEYEVHLIKSYVKEPGVETLDLSNARLEIEDLEVILESLINSQVTDLNLKGNNLNGGMERLAELLVKTKIKTLNISECQFSNADMMHLMKVVNNSEITSLDISRNDNCQLDMSQIEEIASCLASSKITNLNVSWIFAYGTCRPPVFGVLFSRLPDTAVKELHVANNYLSVAELQVLGQSLRDSKVEVLGLSCNWITNDGLNALIPGLVNSRVSQLNLSETGILDFSNLAKCMKDTQIISLDITCNDIGSRVKFPLSQFLEGSCLEDFRFGSIIGKEVSLELMRGLKFSNLKELNVSNVGLTYYTVSECASVIQSTNITKISFSYCRLPIEALYILGECLAGSKLTCINLCGCFRYEREEAALGAAMASIIERTKGSCVKSLNLSENRIGEVRASIVAPKFVETTFTHFDLSGCHIGSGVLGIVTNLKFTSITHLNLSCNSIKDAGAISLVKHLKETQVTELNIRCNGITSEGAKALAAQLKDIKLLSLDLSNNRIESDGLEALAAGAENTLITQLDVYDNPGTTRIICRIIHHVLWKNRASVQSFIHTLKLLAPTGTDNNLQFDRNVDNTDIDGFLDKVLVLYETFVKKPQYVNILIKEKCSTLSKGEILTLMLDEFPKQFSSFISRSIEADLLQHIYLLKRVEDSGLSVLVESLLLNRPTYIIDEEQGILHPYVYTLLKKYKQPLYSLSIDPEFKTKLIEYFTEHADLEFASDVVDLLRNK